MIAARALIDAVRAAAGEPGRAFTFGAAVTRAVACCFVVVTVVAPLAAVVRLTVVAPLALVVVFLAAMLVHPSR